MLSRALIPAALNDIVEGLWGTTPDTQTSTAPRIVLPTGTVEIIFNFGDPLVHVDVAPDDALPAFYVTGQRTRPVLPVIRGVHDLLVISLFPWGAAALFPASLSESDAYAPLGEFVSAGQLSELEDELHAARSLETRARIALSFLDGLRRHADHTPNRFVRLAASRFAASSNRPTIRMVADELGVSQRHLARCFREHVGLTPKMYSRVMRFQAGIEALQNGARPAAIAIDHGYADQAHLSHEMRAFSGKTPSQITQEHETRPNIVTSRMFRCVYL